MKKLILLALMTTILSCGNVQRQVDPLRYKDCVVDDKCTIGSWYSFTVKLTDDLREEAKQDYIQFEVSEREYDLFNIGDTIR